MNDVLTRTVTAGYQIDLRRDDCGCTFGMRIFRTAAGTITVNTNTLQVDREFDEEPYQLGMTRFSTPEPLPHQELPPLLKTYVVEDFELPNWLNDLMVAHFALSLSEAEQQDDALRAANHSAALLRAEELLDAILRPSDGELIYGSSFGQYFWD